MDKTSVLFVCLGNICRSPAAEAIFLKIIANKGIEDKFIVDSAGTGSWHVGKEADKRMKSAAKKRDVHIKSKARQIKRDDFLEFNYILTMDNSNYADVLKIKNSESSTDFSKIIKIQEFSSNFHEKEVPDPYFGGENGFNYVLDILEDSVSGFVKSIL
ncbi:MAG: protein tyrosine phosphatase [Prochlorococcus sp. SP3034]|nr:protein tyrosine phosphatase [Prochlorococcus sp. SP3034]|tara:strand:- start:303 stop:776 length:474 start_codon:yes stop_codon:yes gene_type:complete